jgi:hypothetical protein
VLAKTKEELEEIKKKNGRQKNAIGLALISIENLPSNPTKITRAHLKECLNKVYNALANA